MVLDIQTVHHILKNTAVQNVNKPFVYITDLTSTLTKMYFFVLKFFVNIVHVVLEQYYIIPSVRSLTH
jgi:antibiotic biosynthesis monooxygenase (ABM) superfamily enzyme